MCSNLFRFYERNEDHPMFLSPSCAQSLCDLRLHGVSHDVASPMPVASNICAVEICRIFQHKLAKIYTNPQCFPGSVENYWG